MTNGDAPAFPQSKDVGWHGLTKREYFAAVALQGLLAKGDAGLESDAEKAVQWANWLIQELNRTSTGHEEPS